MNILNNMSVNKKLMAGFGLVLLLTAGLGITAYSQVTTMNNAVMLLEHAEEVNALIQEIDTGAGRAAEITKGVVAAIDEVASVSEESASASEESSSAVQERTAEAQGLSDVAQMMMNELGKFKTRDMGVT